MNAIIMAEGNNPRSIPGLRLTQLGNAAIMGA